MKTTLVVSIWVVALGALAGAFLICREARVPLAPTDSTINATSTDDGGEDTLPLNSGVEGKVSIGPTCPVERTPPDPVCRYMPYATAIFVYRTGAKTPFIIGNSTTLGTFKFSLPPGSSP